MKKVALVTGGSRGIGRAISIALAKSGLPVMINYRQDDVAANETRDLIISSGGDAKVFKADVSNYSEVKTMLEEIKSQGYWVQTLINNAGITRDNIFAMLSFSDWEAVLNTNLNSCYFCIRETISSMIARKSGQIINIASISGLRGQSGQVNYAAAKAGMIAVTKSLAREVGRFNIRVNAIAPGFIETAMLDKMIENNKTKTMLDKTLLTDIPLGRLGKPEEIANAVCFLCSPLASYITGQVLIIDGGLSA
jgi:3-oxoacyl-[acyl-carrier protein] reductase